ncbi:hypothetical protein NRC85_003945 [Vibrio parahaemolyticus]|nr:hypothetical protein [Vibrio parahaemolyticus]
MKTKLTILCLSLAALYGCNSESDQATTHVASESIETQTSPKSQEPSNNIERAMNFEKAVKEVLGEQKKEITLKQPGMNEPQRVSDEDKAIIDKYIEQNNTSSKSEPEFTVEQIDAVKDYVDFQRLVLDVAIDFSTVEIGEKHPDLKDCSEEDIVCQTKYEELYSKYVFERTGLNVSEISKALNAKLDLAIDLM